MKLEPSSYYINNVTPLKDSVKEYLRPKNNLEGYDASREPLKCKIQGGALSDIRYSWLYHGPKLEIIHTKSGSKVAAWNFGAVLHDFETYITCVTELPSAQGKLPILIIGLECEIGGGMICMFDINSSRVLRAIQIDDRVTTVHVINPGCDTSFPGALRAMDGVLAVGTSKGKLILIDLCRQICEEAVTSNEPEYVRDELNVCRLIYLSFYDLNNLEIHRERSLTSGDHLALHLNELSTNGIHFALHGPKGDIRLHANMEEVAISALHYCPQLGSLLVGYNFGAFQLYNLLNVKLEYTSPVYEDCIPITHFAIQEPCDDPRAFCYVWVVYNIIANGDNGFPIAVMYALAYDTKDFLEGYGYLYQEFHSCAVRFQIELKAVPGFRLAMNKNSCTGARCISLNAYTKAVVNRQYGGVQDVPDDKLALCSIVWIAWNQNLNASETYLTLFDLNQWYKEQMPTSSRLDNDALSYMSCESLSELFELSTEEVTMNSNLLDVRLDRNSLSPFVCPQRLEEHYYPTALAFQAICIQNTSIVWIGNYGVQRHLLSQLEQAGPLRLLRPSDLFHRCISLGLTPLYTDVLYSVSTPLNIQREMILNVALEHQLIRWLCCCAKDWANGSQSMAGCTLDMLLDWAWQRANTLKFQSDKLCIPLFDHTGVLLDSNALLQLNHCTCQLKHLTTLFETVVQKCTIYLNEQDLEDIKYQWNALQMISIYLEVLQWLLNVGLLPECPLSMYPRADDSEKISAPYPVESLVRFYELRRDELKNIQSESENKNRFIEGLTRRDLLFIDNLIDIECNGNILHKQWECDGGNGLYPPPSLQALLRVYLIEDIDITHKHCLLIYLFLDLAMTLDQSHYKSIITHLIKFPAVFKLSPSIIKITQAFWQLDHGDFSTAMTQLLDPSVNNADLKPWHHQIVLKALLLQGQHQHALLYHQVRKPPVSTVQDICIIITLLIVNDLLQEAFHFQRCNRNYFNEKEILKHFFTICDKMNQQALVLHLPLCAIEEKEFIDYLKSNPDDKNKNFLVIYYLQRDRYGEAFQINDYLNNNEILKQGLIGQQDKNFRNAIVGGFRKTLPEVTQQLLEYCEKEKGKIFYPNVTRPVPMSVCIHENKGYAKSKSTLIQASFQKAKELWSTKSQSSNILNDLNNTPFICTPKVFRFSPERGNSSIIYPAILDSTNMDTTYDNIENEVTPAKRIKLSPRRSITENQQLKRLSGYSSNSLLNTPIVKRKSIRNYLDNSGIETPTSILKSRSLLRNSISPENKLSETSTTPELIEDNLIDISSKSVQKRTSFGISPRKPIQRTPRPAVHFKERSNSRSSNESGQNEQGSTEIDVHREQTPDKQIETSSHNDSKNSSRSTDDVYYSLNSSINVSEVASSNNSVDLQQPEAIEEESNLIEETDDTLVTVAERSSLKRKANDSIQSRKSYKPSTPVKSIRDTSVRDALKSRRSITKSGADSVEIIVTEAVEEIPGKKLIKANDDTQSPVINKRLRSRQSLTSKTNVSTAKVDSPKIDSPKQNTPKLEPPKPESVNIVPKVKGRRSLSRQVLENNLFSKVVTPPVRMSTRLSMTKLSESDKKKGVEVSYMKSTTSIVKTISDDKIEENCKSKIVEQKDEFSTEKNDKSVQVIKHFHNEIETNSNVTKVTEIVDDDEELKEEIIDNEQTNNYEQLNVLSFSSDVSENEVSHFYQSLPRSEKRYSVLLSTPDKSMNYAEEIDVIEQEKDIKVNETEQDVDKSETTKKLVNSNDSCVEEMKNTQEEIEVDVKSIETSDEEKHSNEDDDDVNIYDDLPETLEEIEDEILEKSEKEIEEDAYNAKESEVEISEKSGKEIEHDPGEFEELIQENLEEESQVSSHSSDIILIKSSSDESKSDQSSETSTSSDQVEILQEIHEEFEEQSVGDEFSEDIEEQSENIEEESENEEQSEINEEQSEASDEKINEESNDHDIEFNKKLDDKLVDIQTTNEDSSESDTDNESNIIKEDFKVTFDETTAKGKPDEIMKKSSNSNMEDINEENMDETNELFINKDIEEMENVEMITEQIENRNISTNKTFKNINSFEVAKDSDDQIQAAVKEIIPIVVSEKSNIELSETKILDKEESIPVEQESIIYTKETDISNNILETNVTKKSETTIKSPNIEESNVQTEEIEASMNPLETNVIQVSKTFIKSQDIEESNVQTEEIDVSVNPLETNVIEISETTIKSQNIEESNVQTEEIKASIESQDIEESNVQTEEIEASMNPLETNVIEVSETTIKSQDIEESNVQTEEIDVSVNPLEVNVIEISETTIKSQDIEESNVQMEEIDASMNPLETNVIEISETSIKSQDIEESNEDIEAAVNPLETNIIEISETPRKPEDIVEEQELIEIKTPTRRTRSASQQSESKKSITNEEITTTSTKLSSRRKSVDETEQKPTPRITRKRSTSISEIIEEPEPVKIRTRRNSKDENKVKRVPRAVASVNLEIIAEDNSVNRGRRATSVDPKSEIEKPRKIRGQSLEPESTTKPAPRHGKKRTFQSEENLQSIPEQIEEYYATHRLTRHQKSIMEKSLQIQQKSRLQTFNTVEQINPIKQLDEESFSGSPDREERVISPDSSISTENSTVISPTSPKRKRGRPSTASPGNSTNTSPEKCLPIRQRRRSFTQAQQAIATTPTRTRRSSRTTSHEDDTASVISISSAMSVPVVALSPLADSNLVRHRSLSPTTLKEETSQKNRRKSTRASMLPSKIDLSKISEETSTSNPEEPNVQKPKRGRPRKTTDATKSSTQSELTDTNVRESELKITNRRSSYKPLNKYLPEHHAMAKTRKTLKVRKVSRDGSH